ncbi:stalk domain-containing protein [Paenibacillus zanthoxyli]|uniref:stalk domain-containing protein n=1 Tax=Paenibacillus zanthoxyli TaxID=369399 RepID=UPI0004719041|nr:stalk domain-containing protein [Paenibacillus zanthoxyli]
MKPRDILMETSAGAAKPSFPHGDTVLLAKNGWTFYADSSAAGTVSRKRQLIQTFSQAAKFATPLSADAKGIVNVSGTGNSTVYSAYWSFDGKTGYKLVSHTSLADFLSVLYSFRPVINLLDQADVVLLPLDSELNWRIGSKTAFYPRENKRTTISGAPFLIDGVPYFPLKDAIAFIKGNMQTVPAENAVYFSEEGYYNQLKLYLKTGQVYKGTQKIATIKIRKANGVTLVPLRFLHEQLGLVFSYTPATQTGKIQHTGWFTNNRALQASGDTLSLSVFGIGSFSYESSRFGSFGSYSYTQSKPPQGYNGRKYAMYRVSIPLLPGDNAFVYRDSRTGRIISTIPVDSALTAADISFRYSGNPSYDSLALNLKLTSSDGTSWPAGYAETSSYADLSGAITAGGNGFSSLRLTLRPAHGRVSKAVSIPVAKDGSFTYRIKPEQGKGTYTVTLYNPPGSLPFDDFAAIVSFTLVVK